MIAAKRQFASAIVESDDFIELPGTAQLLYFHLNMHADNEGIVDSPKRVMKSIGATTGDMQCLIDAGYIIILEQYRVMVVADWYISNSIQFGQGHSARSKHIAAVQCLEKDQDGRYYVRSENLLEVSKRPPGDLSPNTTTNIDINDNIQQQHTDDVVAEMGVEEQEMLAILTAEPWNIMDSKAAKLIKAHGTARVRAFEHKLRPQAKRGEVGAGLLISLIENPNEPTPCDRSRVKHELKPHRYIDNDGNEVVRLI